MRSNSLLAVIGGLLCAAVCHADAPALIPETPSRIELKKNADGAWRFYVNGEEFAIRGAGGADFPGLLEQLKLAGGNCVRTWGIETMEAKVTGGERFIDHAYRLGIMVVPGIWIQHERHGFDYSNPDMIKKQREAVLAAVRRYKDHPAVLAWGLGNEMEDPVSPTGSTAVFKELENLAKLVKEEDPKHPVMSIIAYNPAKVENILRHYPSLDILGINSYSAASGAGEGLKRAGWIKPFAVTEFGVNGQWEVGTTPWKAPFEPTSDEKARSFYATHRLVFDLNEGKELCLGTFAFLWAWKQECTATWYGMFLPTLEKLPQVDAMTKAWTGHWPKNRCPKINQLTSPAYGKVVKPGQTLTATLDVEDPEGDAMTFQWQVVSESTDRRVGGEAEAVPETLAGLVAKDAGKECKFTTPSATGNYRLFVTVHDGKGSAATANFPFRVEP